MKKPRSSLPPNVEMDTHLKFSSGVTSEGLLPSCDASPISKKTQRTSSSRVSTKLSSTSQIRREIFVLDLANAYRHQRSPYVVAQRSWTPRGIDQRFKRERRNCIPPGDPRFTRMPRECLFTGRAEPSSIRGSE